jgi:hypothetical protein
LLIDVCCVITANGKESFKQSGGPSVLLSALKEDYRDEELSYLLLEALNPLVMDDGIKFDLKPLFTLILACLQRILLGQVK